jgi:hypothetical protein
MGCAIHAVATRPIPRGAAALSRAARAAAEAARRRARAIPLLPLNDKTPPGGGAVMRATRSCDSIRPATRRESESGEANAVRDGRIYADFPQSLIGIARPLYVDEPFGVDLKESVCALDTTTIDVRLSVFPWVPFHQAGSFFVTRDACNVAPCRWVQPNASRRSAQEAAWSPRRAG